ncbi:MAG: phenylalanine--tRNA ligase subunit alpha [Firmicutes bacterium]|nr:phenylalanine--tRNA ligase subunit alpha [Bacillota bacterium]
MKEELEKLRAEVEPALKEVKDTKSLEECRIKWLGKKGALTGILKNMGKLTPEERPVFGKLANEVKEHIEKALGEKQEALKQEETRSKFVKEKLDVTLPGKKMNPGRLHPLTTTFNQIKGIFMGLGFEFAEGPEVESDYYNFEALNIPADHPSREMWDSFFINYPAAGLQGSPSGKFVLRQELTKRVGICHSEQSEESQSEILRNAQDDCGVFNRKISDNLLLRSHTTPVQIRVLEKRTPPLRVIASGRCYRRDAVDATHSWMFNQFEGFMVDRDVTFGDLKGVLMAFAREMFGQERRAKFIPSYFPFTEPSAEVAIDCFVCSGKGCRLCKNSGWIEILGCGMIHPRVLRVVNYDTEKYTGFAFGMGVERTAMLKYGIDDIRLFFENDVRFLKQF